MLELKDLAVSYGFITALRDVSLNVGKGAIVTLIGANDAGKSTTLRAISGLLKAQHGSIKHEAITCSWSTKCESCAGGLELRLRSRNRPHSSA